MINASFPPEIEQAIQSIANDKAVLASVAVNQVTPPTTNLSLEQAFTNALPERSKPYAKFLLAHASGPVSALLLWAIMERESASGTRLRADGTNGNGDYGLMQINIGHASEFPEFLNIYRDPETNIGWGAIILASNFKYFSSQGSITKIKGYVIGGAANTGALADPRPLTGAALTAAAVAAYNTGPGNVLLTLARNPLASPDLTTTGHDYSTDVINRVLGLANKISSVGGPTLDVTALATYAMSAGTTAAQARLYRSSYDKAKSYSRILAMQNTSRKGHNDQRSADAVRDYSRLQSNMAATIQSAQLRATPAPAMDQTALDPLMYNFETGQWGDGGKV